MARKPASEGSTKAKTKKTTKTTKTKATTRRTTKAPRVSKLLKSLPESVENIEIVQQVAGILEEMRSRVKDVKLEASKELKKLITLYEGNYKTIEKKVHEVTSEAKKQAQVSMIHLMQKWHEHKEKLPQPLANEVEKIVTHIGTKAMAKRPKRESAKPIKKTKATSKKTKKSAADKQDA